MVPDTGVRSRKSHGAFVGIGSWAAADPCLASRDADIFADREAADPVGPRLSDAGNADTAGFRWTRSRRVPGKAAVARNFRP